MLRALTGVELSQSAITQDALRRARGAVGDAYHRLRGSVRESAVVHTDDTGWRVGGESAFLMAFETDYATVYQVRGRHRNEEVREVVPSDYSGVMVDRSSSELRCPGSVGGETAEVSGARATLDQRGGPDQGGQRTHPRSESRAWLREATERTAQRGDGAAGVIPSGRG